MEGMVVIATGPFGSTENMYAQLYLRIGKECHAAIELLHETILQYL